MDTQKSTKMSRQFEVFEVSKHCERGPNFSVGAFSCYCGLMERQVMGLVATLKQQIVFKVLAANYYCFQVIFEFC